MSRVIAQGTVAVVVAVLIAACGRPDADADADANVNVGDTTPVEAVGPALDTVTLDTVTLIDPGQAPAVADTSGWNYRRSASVDIDGDGEVERVVIAVRVEMVRGRPAWDDGHQWQVYVEEPDSTRTVVYARRLQLGTLTLRIEAGSGSGPRHIILVEHLPDLLAAYEVTYRGPSEFDTHARYQRTLDPTGELASPTLP